MLDVGSSDFGAVDGSVGKFADGGMPGENTGATGASAFGSDEVTRAACEVAC
jgi:hypothetical protein